MNFLAGFFTAVITGYFIPSIKGLILLCAIAFIALILIVKTKRGPLWRLTILGILLGFLHITQFAMSHQAKKLPESQWQQPLSVTFTVLEKPKLDERSQRFLAEIQPLNIKANLSWYDLAKNIQRGQTWNATVKLKPIRGYANPGGRDYERYHMQEGVYARGYVVDKLPHQLISTHNTLPFYDQLREKIKTYLYNANINPNMQPLLLALATGERDGMNDNHWDVFKVTGTAHLMAISGLHVGLVLGVFYFLIYPISRFITSVYQVWPAKFVATIISSLLAGFYVLLSGMALSTLRAYVMLGIVCVFLCAYRRNNLAFSLLFTACFFLLIDPLAAMQLGFILSFGSVALILLLMQGQFVHQNKYVAALSLQWRLSILIVPLTLMALNTFSLTSPLANTLAIPWVSFIVVPALLFYDVAIVLNLPFADYLLILSAWSMELLWWFLSWLSDYSWSPMIGISQPWQWIALTVAFIAPRAYLPVFLLVVFMPWMEKPKEGELWLTVLDVGQGLANVVQTKHHTLIYDTGFPQGDTVLLPFLNSQQIKKIDMLLISHSDADHRNGTEQLLNKMVVDQILVGEVIDIIPDQPFCQRGQRWEWDGVIFEVLHPEHHEHWDRNNRSCVLRIKAGDKQLLLTGDIKKEVESHLVTEYSESLKSDVVVVPHHGSKTSSTKAFVQAVAPRYALISAGFLSQYGHPHKNVVANYDELGSQLYYTAHQGAIRVKMGIQGVEVDTYREQYKRWWDKT